MSEIDWAAARMNEARLEELIKHQRRLMDRSLVSRSDESSSARRRFKDLIGLSDIDKMLEGLVLGEEKH